MYVTRRLSSYVSSPESLRDAPPAGPASGFLVVGDVGGGVRIPCCLGLCKDKFLKGLPFPQDRRLTVQYNLVDYTVQRPVYFVPAVGLPLSSHRYYAVLAKGADTGKVSMCSSETREFNCGNIYQQVEILPDKSKRNRFFIAKPVASNGILREPFARNGRWCIYGSSKHVWQLPEALGIDASLRVSMPEIGVTRVIGRWYCPFMFVREEKIPLKNQVKNNLFYGMILQQFWEEIYECDNLEGRSTINVSVGVVTQRTRLRGEEAVREEVPTIVDGVKWFKSRRCDGVGVGLSMVVVERMRWEEEMGGWAEGKERVEEFCGKIDGWKKFRCYVLVERFALRRMDGTILLTFDFRHTHKTTCKWE